MINENLRLYSVQTHVHGSGGHGRVSHQGYDFNTLCESMRMPPRDIKSPETWSAIELCWEKTAGTEAAQAVISRDHYLQGSGSLKLSLTEPDECIYQLNVENDRQKMPVFTYPIVKINILPGLNFSAEDEAFIRFGLGQKLPDFNPAVLTYTFADNAGIILTENGCRDGEMQPL